jgi:demethylmenaquinone methyltransferase / 2-methoxy-6-polyprenyl-1,4-benzoquinol methylase
MSHELIRLGSGAMFDRIAARYDLLNRLLSFGVDRRWRRRTARATALPQRSATRVLDLASGTGDLAIEIAKQYPLAEVVGVDPSEKMLAQGRRKVLARGLGDRVHFAVGDGMALAFPNHTFDAATIAFGIRNIPDRRQSLRELARVVRPGGRICILELSEPNGNGIDRLAQFHVHHIVPRLGAFLSGSREYRYLQQSIAAFPSASAFAEQIVASGLRLMQTERLSFGVCHLYVAEVIDEGAASKAEQTGWN